LIFEYQDKSIVKFEVRDASGEVVNDAFDNTVFPFTITVSIGFEEFIFVALYERTSLFFVSELGG
jgi:hypothetical protein